MKIKFGEIKIGATSRNHVIDCLDTNKITMGEKVKAFEAQWCNIFGYKYARLLASGTAAGTACCMAMYSMGAKPGDEVICPSLSFIATANAIRMANLTPKFVDIDRRTLNINEELIERAITPKTKAIVVVNTMGRPCDMELLQTIAKNNKLIMIVDNCEGYGCKFKDKYCLDYADMETSSHYVAHCVVSCEGGCAATNNEEIDLSLESIRSHGRRGGSLYFNHVDFGGNFKTSDLHASIGLGELENFWENFHLRHHNMMMLHKGLHDYKEYFWTSDQDTNCVNCPHGFSITLKDPKFNIEKLKQHLTHAEIEFKRNFGSIPTQHQAFKYLGHQRGEFPEGEYVGEHGIHFGVHRYLTSDNLNYIINVVRDYFDEI